MKYALPYLAYYYYAPWRAYMLAEFSEKREAIRFINKRSGYVMDIRTLEIIHRSNVA